MSCACALGRSNAEVLENALKGSSAGMTPLPDEAPGRPVLFGAVPGGLPGTFEYGYEFRACRLLLHALRGFEMNVSRFLYRHSSKRVAVVLGVSNTGIDEAQRFIDRWFTLGHRPGEMHFSYIELGSPATFLKRHLGVKGPAYSISTACSSSAKAFATARRLIAAGIVDAAIVGGVDSRCRFALNGFNSLSALSQGLCRPFADDRDGINLGEGVALFLMEKANTHAVDRSAPAVVMAGCGETSDAFHATAPDPEGRGAEAAMRAALADAGLSPDDVAYVNLHGTGTPANDEMERKAVERVFARPVFRDPVAAGAAPRPDFSPGSPTVESTKAMTGHCLGAAGAVEAAICWLYMKAGVVSGPALSNSFAFGGSNVCLALAPKGPAA